MPRGILSALVLTTITASLVAMAGCSTGDGGSANEAALTPAPAQTDFALADSCARLFKRHASLRDVDIATGVVRWGCGDVPGVTAPDLGQEYCEYNAVQNGRPVTAASGLTTGKVSCVFTSVFTGGSSAPSLRQAMGDAANLGVAAQSDNIVQMQKSFNARSAATALLSDCSNEGSAESVVSRERMAACYEAYAAGGANAATLKTLCGAGSVDDATWAKVTALGAKIHAPGEPGYDGQQDIVSCMRIRGAGVSWRNSDPMICARTERSARECSCAFGAVPNTLQGLPFTGWVDDHIPSSCRLAKVNGQDYPSVAICDLTDQEVADLPLNASYSRSLQNFCHDRFGVDLVMKLPLRALKQQGTCSESAGFCKDYMSGGPGVTTVAETTSGPTRSTGAPDAPISPVN